MSHLAHILAHSALVLLVYWCSPASFVAYWQLFMTIDKWNNIPHLNVIGITDPAHSHAIWTSMYLILLCSFIGFLFLVPLLSSKYRFIDIGKRTRFVFSIGQNVGVMIINNL